MNKFTNISMSLVAVYGDLLRLDIHYNNKSEEYYATAFYDGDICIKINPDCTFYRI